MGLQSNLSADDDKHDETVSSGSQRSHSDVTKQLSASMPISPRAVPDDTGQDIDAQGFQALAELAPNDAPAAPKLSGLSTWFSLSSRAPELKERETRIRSELIIAEQDYERRFPEDSCQNDSTLWAARREAGLLRKQAENALDRGDLVAADRSLKAARRLEIFGYSDLERRLTALGLHREVPSLITPWRRESIQAALTQEDSSAALSVDTLIQASAWRDDDLDDQYHFRTERRKLRWRLSLAILISILALAGLSYGGILTAETLNAGFGGGAALAILVTGGLGGIVSAAIDLWKGVAVSLDGKKPVLESVSLRGLLGGALAIAAYIVLSSGILDAVIGRALLAGPGLLATAAVAGFCERFVRR